MFSDTDHLMQRLRRGDPAAVIHLLDVADTTISPQVLVAAAVAADRPALLARAALNATTGRERQLVSIAVTYFERNQQRLHGLVHDHLADHPDDLAAWIADRPPYPATDHPTPPPSGA